MAMSDTRQLIGKDDLNEPAPPPYPGPSAPVVSSELPPPYTERAVAISTAPTTPATVSTMMISCQVCHTPINITGKKGRVVECGSCHEATAIKPAPVGRKYTRCPCNCLLTCNVSSTKVSCPRADCRRILSLTVTGPVAAPIATQVNQTPNSDGRTHRRFHCAYCSNTFIFDDPLAGVAKCPYCQNKTAAGTEYARFFTLVAIPFILIFFAIGSGICIGVVNYAMNDGYFALVAISFSIAGSLLLRLMVLRCMPVSQPVHQPA